MLIYQYAWSSIGRILFVTTPYIVVALLVLIALIILIRHFRAGKSSHNCCGATGSPGQENHYICMSGHSCRNCSVSSCPTLQQGTAKKPESDNPGENGV